MSASQKRKIDPRLLWIVGLLALAFAGEQIYYHFLRGPEVEQTSRALPVGGRLVLHIDSHALIRGYELLKPARTPESWQNTHPVQIVSPGDTGLIDSRFRVDLVLAGPSRPESVELWMGSSRVASVTVDQAAWKSPGQAMFTGVWASSKLEPGWYHLQARVLKNGAVVGSSKEVRVYLARLAQLTPLPATFVADVKQALSGTMTRLIIALDRARRHNPTGWRDDLTYLRYRGRLLQQLSTEDLQMAAKAIFDAVENRKTKLALVAGDLLNTVFERRKLPFFISVSGVRYMSSGREQFYLFAYLLESPIPLTVMGQKYFALTARRLDKLNVRRSLLGHKSTGLARAVLLVEQIAQLRKELDSCLTDLPSCSKRWIDRRGPGSIVSATVVSSLKAILAEIRQKLKPDCDVGSSDRCRERLMKLLLRMVAHHEVRHVFDHRYGLKRSKTIGIMLRRLLQKYGARDATDAAMRLTQQVRAYNTIAGANAEMSAFLAEIAEVGGMGRYTIYQLHAYATEGRGRQSYRWASRAILAGLGRLAGLEVANLASGENNDPRWGGLLRTLIALDSEKLAGMAAKLYRQEFGQYHPASISK